MPALTGTALPTFQWTAVPGATSYTLLVSPERCFPDAQTIRIDGINGTSYALQTMLSSGIWYWTVRAVDASGGGHYLKTVQFGVGALPAAQVDPAKNLNCEEVSAWSITDTGMTGGWGTVWVFKDSDLHAQGDSSARFVFTVNSRHRGSGTKNPGTSSVPVQWSGPVLDFSAVSSFTFKLYPHRFPQTDGTIVSPSRFLHVKMLDPAGGVVLDAPVDPAGTLPKDSWSLVTIPFGAAARNAVSKIVFYINCGDSKLTWDARMTFNIDYISTDGPADVIGKPTDASVTFSGIVTAGTDHFLNTFYVQEPDRSCGIRVYAYAAAARAGDIVNVSGTMRSASGARYVYCLSSSYVTQVVTGEPVPRPLVLRGRDIGGTFPYSGFSSIYSGPGAYNIGLLVTVTGRVLSSTASYFYIDDGSCREDTPGVNGLRIQCAGLAPGNPAIPIPLIGQYVRVTGIAQTIAVGAGKYIPVVSPRTAADVVTCISATNNRTSLTANL